MADAPSSRSERGEVSALLVVAVLGMFVMGAVASTVYGFAGVCIAAVSTLCGCIFATELEDL